MTLYLIRHGETELNASRVVQFPGTPLGDRGKLQAIHLSDFLGSQKIKKILTSDYLRARMTAESIRDKTQAELLEISALRERNFGDIRGKHYDDFEGIDIFAQDYLPPGGESWTEFNQRVDRAWAIVQAHLELTEGNLAVVTHGLVLRSLLERLLDTSSLPLEEDLVLENTCVTEVQAAAPWRVISLAKTDHLNEASSAGGAPV